MKDFLKRAGLWLMVLINANPTVSGSVIGFVVGAAVHAIFVA